MNGALMRGTLRVIELHGSVDGALLAEELNESIYAIELLIEEVLGRNLLEENLFGEPSISPKGLRQVNR